MGENPIRYGLVPREQVLALSGLDFILASIAGTLPAPPFAEVIGMRVIAAERGRVTIEADTDGRFLNPYGSVHAGWTTTLLDSAMSLTVLSMLPAGQGQTTVELKVNCVRPVLPETGRVRVDGKIIHAGRQIATAEARAVDASGKLLAHAVCTCLVFDAAPR